MKARPVALGAAAALCFTALGIFSSDVGAQEPGCTDLDPVTLQCGVDFSVPGQGGGPTPGDTPDGGQPPPGGPTAPAPPVERLNAPCPSGWEAVDPGTLDPEDAAAIEGMANPQRCATSGLFRPAPPDEPTPPAAEDLAADLLISVKAQMKAPSVASDPPTGTASIVSLPVFVEVTNWQGEQSDSRCDTGVCVEIVATPTLLFYPGEPDARPMVCNPPGTRYDPNGAEPEVQASASGACAYIYSLRSGVDGRPEQWPAEVRVTWDVRWTSTQNGAPGPSGSFDPISMATAVPRQVSEVQTVVVDGSTE